MSVRLNIELPWAGETTSRRRLPGTWHAIKPWDSGKIAQWETSGGLGCYIEVTPDDFFRGGYALVVWGYHKKLDWTDRIGPTFTNKKKAFAQAYRWMSEHATATEFSPRKSYQTFLRKHKTTRAAGRGVRRGLKRGTGFVYHRL